MKRRSTHHKARRNASLRDTCCRRLLLGGRSLGFEALEPRQLLSIDPSMGWAQFFGGTGADIGYGVAVDMAGNAYVTGRATSSDFAAEIPTVQGREYKGAGDVFVVKVGADGAPQWKAFLGGSGYEYSRAIAVDASGAIFIAGNTESNDLQSDFGQRRGGDYDAFVAKLTPDGELEWSSCLGGNGGDDAFGIAVDALGNAWVTGWTTSSNFPASSTNSQGFDTSCNGDRDAFLAKFTSSGQLDWGSYLGGSGLDHGDAVTVDIQGNAYVTGRASSSDFAADVPIVPGREYHGGNGDFFVVKVGADGAPQWKAFVGGSGYEYSRAVAVDASGAIFIAGNTESNDPQSDFGPRRGGDYDAVVVKLTPNGELEWGSCLGGNGGDDAFGIAVDALGNAWVTGWTSSSDFPASSTNSQGFDTSYNGDRDGFLAKFTSSGQLDWGSYLGGSGYDHAWGIAADPRGIVFVAGETTSTAFDSLSSAPPYVQHADGSDVFVAKIADTSPVDLSGRVFDDRDNDGQFDPGDGDKGIAGVSIDVWQDPDGIPNSGDEVLRGTTATLNDNPSTPLDEGGLYQFTDPANGGKLGPGTYILRQQAQPSGYLDGKETAGDLGGIVDNTKDCNGITHITLGEVGTQKTGDGYNFAEIHPSGIQGMVWEDFNNDGEVNFGEKAIEGVTVTLTGMDDRGAVGPIEAGNGSGTDTDGIYMFVDLRPGEYSIKETQPAGYLDGQEVLGEVVETEPPSPPVVLGSDGFIDPVENDKFSGIVLVAGSCGVNYNFGERPPANGVVTAGQTATIGFWQNKNGQALIRSLNDDTDPMRLGDWLSATFPKMYGTLGGQTNDGVADFYTGLFLRTKKEAVKLGLTGPVKMDAQVMAVAFACYVTNETLAGTTAATYGFLVTANGVGTSTFNVGTSGQAFGAANGSVLAILDLLFATNDRSWNGVLYDLDHDGSTDDTVLGLSETLLRTLANDVYSAINERGHL